MLLRYPGIFPDGVKFYKTLKSFMIFALQASAFVDILLKTLLKIKHFQAKARRLVMLIFFLIKIILGFYFILGGLLKKLISIFERIIPPIFSFFSAFLSGKIISEIEIRLKVNIFIRCLISGIF